MWTLGNQLIKHEKDFNEEIAKIQGELDDNICRITLAKFLYQNIGFTIHLLSGVELLPMQEIAIKGILKRDNGLVVAGRGGGKSFLISILAFLCPIFNFNSKVCLVSANFRGSRRILESTERIITSRKARLLLQCFQTANKTRSIVRRAPDMYQIDCADPSGSQVFALPLTEGLRGVRASHLIADEGLMISKELQTSIIRPFLNARLNMQEEIDIRTREDELVRLGELKEEERTIFPKNKFSVFSSASYQFEYLYEMYTEMVNNIINPNIKKDNSPPTYFVMRFAYDAIPENTIIDTTQIETAKASGDENSAYFKREYLALFTDSSESYYNVRKMFEATVPALDFPTTQLIGEKNEKYILSIDPSYASNKNSDFFAMGIYLINESERKITLVHTYGRAGGDLKEHFDYLTYLLLFFNIVFVVIDGSGTEFITGYNESTIAKEKNLKLDFLTADLDTDDAKKYMEEIAKVKNQYNQTSRKMVWPQYFNSSNNVVRRMNESLQNSINAKKVWFASPCGVNEKAMARYGDFSFPFVFKDNDDKIYDLSSFISDQDEWINQTKSQLALIEVKATSSGVLQYDLPQSLRRINTPNKPRKDHYTCILLANWAIKFYFDMVFANTERKQDIPMPLLVQ